MGKQETRKSFGKVVHEILTVTDDYYLFRPYAGKQWSILNMNIRLPRSFSLIPILLLTACGGPLVGVTVVDERTALENQVLGTYQELNQEVLLVASVRYIDPKGKLKKAPAVPPGKKHVIRSIQRASFNKDDIDRFKAKGILGENNQGGINLLNPEVVTADQRPFIDNLVQEENTDRENIMQRVIDTNENLSDKDLPRVRKMFASLNRDKARPGEMIQLENGDWVKKEKP